jgi:hypothetical protein
MGVIEAYRHIRGMALKQAILDYFLENQENILTGNYNVDEILKLAEEHTKKICDYNIESLRKMIVAESSETEYLLRRFDEISRDYVKVLVALVAKWVSQNKEEINKGYKIPLIQIGSYFEKLPDEFKIGRYTAFSRLEQKLPENLEKINSEVRLFGFELIKIQKDIFISFLNEGRDILKLSSALYQQGNSGNMGKTGNEITEITQVTHITQSDMKVSY